MAYKYNTHYYWENVLHKNKDIWRCDLIDNENLKNTVFFNTAIIDYNRDILDNNWGCYPSVKAVLGFIQYIYLPTVFFCTLNKENKHVITPICSNEEFIEYIKKCKFHKKYLNTMEENLKEIDELWNLSDEECFLQLKKFCNKFNNVWNDKYSIFYINIFSDTFQIADNVMKEEFVEVIEEDIGITKQELYDFCNNVYTNKLINKMFIKFLNNRIGCLV